MTATYWEIGRKIIEHEQEGKNRATYGKELLQRLGADLTAKFGRGFGWRNLYQMLSFYLAYPRILQTPSAKSESANYSKILQTPPADYRTALPNEKTLVAEVERTRKMLEDRVNLRKM